MIPDAERDCECLRSAAAVRTAILVTKKTDAAPSFPHSTDCPEEESGGKFDKIVNPKIAIGNNLQLLTSEKYQHIDKYMATENIMEYCKGAAKRLSNVISWVKNNGDSRIFLKEFAHSASCGNNNCRSFCKLFKRLRKHVMSAKHKCSLLRIYSLLLRLHVNACTNDKCGLEACPILRSRKELKRKERDKIVSLTKPCSDHILQYKKLSLIPTILTSKMGNRVMVFFARPINREDTLLQGPTITKLAE